MTPKQTFEYGLLYHHYANTAYPLTPGSFKQYRIKDEKEIPAFLESEWAKTDELSLYVHVPFCQVRCRFCEYTVLEKTDISTEDLYLSLLLKEIDLYKKIIKDKKIVGYDLGGGTPTKLSIENLQKVTTVLIESFNFQDDVIFSIETTPIIAAKEPEKIKAAFEMGYKRISMGVQTVSEKLLNELGREGTTHIYEKATQNIRKAGYKMFNIDLMYGFLHQTNEEFETTIKYAIELQPEYITLYRNRYKGTKLEKEAQGVSLYKIINQYQLAYKVLTENGYEANVGKNTFSRIKNDYGTSDYLTKRVIEGTPYVGMGLGAQSFGMDYLAYNDGAASKMLLKYKQKIERGKFPIQDIYALDKQESIAKMVSVAFYFGFIDIDAFRKRFNLEFLEYFKTEVDFVTKEGLMELRGSRIYLTNRGSDYINGVIPLFYSERSKEELAALYKKTEIKSDGEEEFLKAYNIEAYERPSLATDIVVFTNGKEKKEDLSVVLIRRGEHPYMYDWALPGGFVKPNESAEQTAYRELKEEAGISDVILSQLHTFSEPKRDPRGWIVSCSFVAVVKESLINLQFGDDAIDSQLFRLNYKIQKISENDSHEIKHYHLSLTNEDIELKAIIEKKTELMPLGEKTDYQIIESKGIAFDHAKIMVVGLDKII